MVGWLLSRAAFEGAALRLSVAWCRLRDIFLQSTEVAVTSLATGRDQQHLRVAQVLKRVKYPVAYAKDVV